MPKSCGPNVSDPTRHTPLANAIDSARGTGPSQKYTNCLIVAAKPAKHHQKKIDPSFVITHRIKLEDAPEAYRMFRDEKEGCVKVVIDFA
ncbi:MAG: hypothetical protein ACRD4X_10245 [Candidatus Acidiferrales bacterium]